MVLSANRSITPRKNKKIKKTPLKIKHKNRILIRGYPWIIIFLFLILFDRVTKLWAAGIHSIIDYNILSLHFVTNTGAGFSILSNHNTFLIWLSIIIAGLAIYFHELFPKYAFVMIMSGLTSNLIDRIVHGYVIDFIDFKFWPVFNIADSLIFLGVAITIISLLLKDSMLKH